ncbi:MAG TPA: YdjY domain-containing protein [Chthoniobacteraceae bacterium]|jgi:hypothetical protein|nr:YdjY domain-containing protein [Chthoniobacteraceae bacterium]
MARLDSALRLVFAALLLCGTVVSLRAAPDPTIDFRGIQIDKVKRTITFPAEINMTEGLLEYLLVNDMGKTHESLLSTKIQPYDIQVAMLLLGIKPAANANAQPPAQLNRAYLQNAPQLAGDKIDIHISWQDGQGQHLVRAEDLIWNLKRNAVMTPGPWIYNGSEMYEGRFLAQVDGSIGALVRDSAALLNNPRPGNDDDQIWQPYAKVTPKVGTAVDVTIELENAP